MAINVFLKGRKTFADNQLFASELLSIYNYKKDKAKLIEEYINVLGPIPQMLPQAKNALSTVFESKSADQLFI